MGQAAPLITTPAAPIPAGGVAEWVTGAGGLKLRAAFFPATQLPRGSVILSTGRTEPIEKYFEVVEDLLARGFAVLVQEWRGQGLSSRELPDRLYGHASGFAPYLEDFHAVLAAFEDRLPKPWIAIGHSMGGCLTLLALARGEAARFAAAVLTAPMLGLNLGRLPQGLAQLVAVTHVLLGKAGRQARKPTNDPFQARFAGNVLTHDQARFARTQAQIAADHDLALGEPTWGWLDFALRATAYLARPEHLRGVRIPVLICAAEHDRLVLEAPQRAVAAHLSKGKFVVVPGALHEILMETDDRRAVFWREFDVLADTVAPLPVPTWPTA